MNDLIAQYSAAIRSVGSPNLPFVRPSQWARHYAEIEPRLEAALGGICWDYPDRATVCAAVQLLDTLAGIDSTDSRRRQGIADGFREVAEMVESTNE